jgi:hypothetical protein
MPIDYSGNADILDAFEGALKELTVERTHPEALVIAEQIITFAKAGVRDPAQLRYLAVAAIRADRRRSTVQPWALGRPEGLPITAAARSSLLRLRLGRRNGLAVKQKNGTLKKE